MHDTAVNGKALTVCVRSHDGKTFCKQPYPYPLRIVRGVAFTRNGGTLRQTPGTSCHLLYSDSKCCGYEFYAPVSELNQFVAVNTVEYTICIILSSFPGKVQILTKKDILFVMLHVSVQVFDFFNKILHTSLMREKSINFLV